MLPEARIEPRTSGERVRVAVSRATRRVATTCTALAYGACMLVKMIVVVAVPLLPVLGAGAVTISPRVGHLHVTVDDLPWHWGDFGDNQTLVVDGLPPGPHKILIELADADHQVLAKKVVTFEVPRPSADPVPAHPK